VTGVSRGIGLAITRHMSDPGLGHVRHRRPATDLHAVEQIPNVRPTGTSFAPPWPGRTRRSSCSSTATPPASHREGVRPAARGAHSRPRPGDQQFPTAVGFLAGGSRAAAHVAV